MAGERRAGLGSTVTAAGDSAAGSPVLSPGSSISRSPVPHPAGSESPAGTCRERLWST